MANGGKWRTSTYGFFWKHPAHTSTNYSSRLMLLRAPESGVSPGHVSPPALPLQARRLPLGPDKLSGLLQRHDSEEQCLLRCAHQDTPWPGVGAPCESSSWGSGAPTGASLHDKETGHGPHRPRFQEKPPQLPHPSRSHTTTTLSPNAGLTFLQIEIGDVCRRFFVVAGKAFEVIRHLTGLLSGLSPTSPTAQTPSSLTGSQPPLPLSRPAPPAHPDPPPGLSLRDPALRVLLTQGPVPPKGVQVWRHQSFVCKTAPAPVKARLPSRRRVCTGQATTAACSLPPQQGPAAAGNLTAS